MRLASRIVVVMLLLLAVLLAGATLYLRTSLPTEGGVVEVAGVAAPVQVVRDRNGVPHIYGQSIADTYFGLGYAHAQDRLWQMEINRRVGAGRLSEIVGPAGLDIDRLMRTLGFRRLAEKQAAESTGLQKQILEAYAAGVNAYVNHKTGALPPEFVAFRLLAGLKPEPWTPADSLTWHKLMAFDLSGNWFGELSRMRLAQKLTPQQMSEFFPPYPGDAPVTLADLGPLYREAAKSIDLTQLAALAPNGAGEGLGSNNWVVSGNRTATGKPLLANDPHLGLTAPTIWYLAHLSAPGMDAVGATFPGAPAVVLGRNQNIAWGMTNTGPDTQDLYLEKVDPTDPARYMTPDGPRAFDTREEAIRVRGGEAVRLTVRATRHGPVLSDLARFANVPPGEVLALQWTALDPNDRSTEAIENLSRARNWDDFTASLRNYGTPQQSIVFADTAGNTGFIAPGRIPIRRPDNDLRGLAPAPGWDAKYDWAGYVPFEQLPRAYNPASGAVVTANNKIVPDSYPYFLTSEWAEPYRARRIEQLLAAREAHTVESFKAMQADVLSLMAADLLPLMLRAPVATGDAQGVRDLLAQWNGRAEADRAEPLLFAAWYRELARLIQADELGEALRDAGRQRPLFVRNVLADVGGPGPNGQARWCDDVTTAGAVETCDQLIARALDLALADLKSRYGNDAARWRWGIAHEARGTHRPFSNIPVLRDLFEIRVPSAGDTFTVNVGRHNPGNEAAPFANVHAAALRAIYDMADADHALFMISTGQSGNILSDLYRNLAKPWAAGEYLTVSTRRAEIDAGARGTLTLQPR